MNTKGPVIILHFSPVEFYPPVMNLLNYASQNGVGYDWILITTKSGDEKVKEFYPSGSGIVIKHKGCAGNQFPRLNRLWTYLSFYMSAFLMIIRKRPRAILYFETLSSLPVVLNKFIFKKRSKILVHYHEYVSPAEYRQGSLFFRFLWRLERRILPFTDWISHTNRDRLGLFLEDVKGINKESCHVLPNYPPRSWKLKEIKDFSGFPLKVIYLGASLSADNMYLKEFASWVNKNKGSVIWDIYSNNPDPGAVKYLKSLNAENIRLKCAFEYEKIPEVLGGYDVGVILYNGHLPNIIYCAPNKLFEYHVNGLDVWFPKVMAGCLPYVTNGTYPKIVGLDFDQLKNIKPEILANRVGMNFFIGQYCYEDILPVLIGEIEKSGVC